MSQQPMRVEVPGKGIIEFPAGTSESDIEAAIGQLDAEPSSGPDFATRTTPADGLVERAAATSTQALGWLPTAALKGYADVNVGAVKGAAHTVVSLSQLASQVPGMRQAMTSLYGITPEELDARYQQAEELTRPVGAAQQAGFLGEQIAETILPGGAVSKAGTALATRLPRGMHTLGRMAAEGAGGAGISAVQGGDATTGGAVSAALPPVVAALRSAGRAIAPKANAALQGAVDVARRYDIPVDAATATGNRMVRSVQDIVGRATLSGGLIRDRFEDAREAGMARTARALADQASPTPVVPEQAGEGMRQAVSDVVEAEFKQARKAYGELERIANLPQNQQRVTVGTKVVDTGRVNAQGQPITRKVPVTKVMALPVDMRAIKQQFQPIRERMDMALPLAVQRASPGYKAISNILDGADFVPASVADLNLSMIKGIAREAEPALRNVSEGFAARAVSSLEDAVQQAVAKGGPKAEAARNAGRAATVAKYQAADVLKQLREEPVQAFQQAVYANDAGIDLLRDVAKLAPAEMPKVGRAYLEKLFTQATEKGGFAREDGLFRAWQTLGPETKKVLFPNPMLRRDLDGFFQLATRMAENSNRPGSGFTALLGAQGGYAVLDPFGAVVAQIPPAMLGGLLYTPRGVKLLTDGLKLPDMSPARAGAVVAQLRQLAERTTATATTAPTPGGPAPDRRGTAR